MAGNQVGIDIVARATGFQAEFQKIAASAKTAAASVSSAFGQLRFAAGAIGIPLGITALVSALDSIREKTADGERVLNQLNAVLKATGNSAGLTARGLEQLTSELQSKSIFDDDAIRAAETALLRFRTVQGDVFKDAIRLAPDLAAALGTDLPAAAGALGKALTDPESGMKALKAAGLSLSEQQKDLAARFIESGDKASAQRIVLDELTKSVGGASEADNKGLYGASKRLARAWEDLQKVSGKKIFTDNVQNIDAMTGALGRLSKMAEETNVNFGYLAKNSGALLGLAADVVKTTFNIGQDNKPKREVSGKIGGLPDPAQLAADAAAAEQDRKQREDQAYLDQQRSLKQRVEGAAQANAAVLATTKSFLDRQSALYEAAYARNELATSDFYAQQRQAAQATAQAVIAGLTKQGEAVERLMAAPSTSRDERAGLFTKLQGIAAESDRARIAVKQQILELDIREADAIDKLSTQYAGLAVRLADLGGDRVKAATLGFDQSNADFVARLEAEASSGNEIARMRAASAKEQLDAIRALTIQQAELTNATIDYQMALDKVGNAQERIDIQVRSGALTELEGLRATSELRARSIQQLTEQLALAQRAAEAISAPAARAEALAGIEQMQLALEDLAATGDLVAKKFNEIGQGAFSSFLQELTKGNWKDAIKNAGQNLFDRLNTVVADNLSQKAFGKDGIFSGFGDILGGLFGGKPGETAGAAALTGSASALTASGSVLTTAGATLTASAAALSSAAALMGASSSASSAGGIFGAFSNIFDGGGGGDILTGLQGFATGTPFVPRTQLALIHKGERIIPAAQNRRDAQFGGRQTIHQTVNILPGATAETSRQALRRATDAASYNRRRGR